jgi:hypothetical protein
VFDRNQMIERLAAGSAERLSDEQVLVSTPADFAAIVTDEHRAWLQNWYRAHYRGMDDASLWDCHQLFFYGELPQRTDHG